MKKEIKLIDFQAHIDDRGSLVVIEELKSIPFSPKRIFYTFNVNDDKTRGNHANINSEFVMVAVKGSVKIDIDDGKKKYSYVLDDPTKGLYIPNLTWKTMSEFSKDAVLMVIANTLYDKSEYINDYDEFIKYLKTRK